MTVLNRLLSVLTWLFHRQRVEQNLDDELQAFLDMSAAEKMRDGLSPAEARRVAFIELGGIEQVKERVRASRHGGRLDEVGRDLRYALHAMVKRPVFATTAVLTLALSIGASMSVYALVRGLYFRAPDGVTDPDQLVGISQQKGVKPISEVIRYPDYLYYRDHQTVFSGLASHFWRSVIDTERSEEVDAFFVSSNYFSVLGVTPSIGRFFGPESENDPVVTLSYSFWQRRFDANPNCIGQRLILGGVPFTITGVAAPNFKGALVGWPVDVFVPTMMARIAFPDLDILSRDSAHLNLLGRLRPDRTIADARTEMTVLARQLEQAFPETNRDLGVTLYALHPSRNVATVQQVDTPAHGCHRLPAAGGLCQSRGPGDGAKHGTRKGHLYTVGAWGEPGPDHSTAGDRECGSFPVRRRGKPSSGLLRQ
jgi:macrolide transport system ATP-binding/permease protein